MGKPHRTYTPEFKVRVVLEIITSKKSLSQASREYGIKDSVLSRWRQEFLERAPQVFEQPRAEGNQAQQRIAELERMVGRQALQLEMAKKVFGSSDFLLKGDE
jgi:transposase